MKNIQEIISELEVKGYSLVENLLPIAIVEKVRIDTVSYTHLTLPTKRIV